MKICKICEAPFEPKRKEADIYCSVECRRIAQTVAKEKHDKKQHEVKKCIECGAEFTAKNKETKYCAKCRNVVASRTREQNKYNNVPKAKKKKGTVDQLTIDAMNAKKEGKTYGYYMRTKRAVT